MCYNNYTNQKDKIVIILAIYNTTELHRYMYLINTYTMLHQAVNIRNIGIANKQIQYNINNRKYTESIIKEPIKSCDIAKLFETSKQNTIFCKKTKPTSLFTVQQKSPILYFAGTRETQLSKLNHTIRQKQLLYRCIYHDIGIFEDNIFVEDIETNSLQHCETITHIDTKKNRAYAVDIQNKDNNLIKDSIITRIDFFGETWRWCSAVAVSYNKKKSTDDIEDKKGSIVSVARIRFDDDSVLTERAVVLDSATTSFIVDSQSLTSKKSFNEILKGYGRMS